jgi:hypothetical protein
VRIGSLIASGDSAQVDYTVAGAAAAALQGVRLPREEQQHVEVHVQFDLVPKVNARRRGMVERLFYLGFSGRGRGGRAPVGRAKPMLVFATVVSFVRR